MFLSRASALRLSLKRSAGQMGQISTVPEFLGQGYGHLEIKYTYLMMIGVACFNAWIWTISAFDPRYYFGKDQKKNFWKKYMSKNVWVNHSGFISGHRAWDIHKFPLMSADPCYPRSLHKERLGFKQAWRRDLYRLIVELESADPAKYPL